MGVWATGLYAGDFALDLRSTIGAVLKLPFDSARLLDVLCQSERAAADHSDDPDHTTFWLVVSDQFAKRGIESKRAREMALEIIDSDSDLAGLEKLGMQVSDLRKRKKVLEQVRQRIMAPTVCARPREVMKRPQPFLMQTGDVLIYPTFGGRCRNPYFVDQDKDRMGTASLPWQIDGWAAMVVVDFGRAFDFLAWYRPLVLASAVTEKPNFAMLQGGLIWRLAPPGTCSASHFKRMRIEKSGAIVLDQKKLATSFGELCPGTAAAVRDISIANQISAGPHVSPKRIAEPGNLASVKLGTPYAAISGLRQIAEW